MTTEIRVPALGESATEATVAKWMKAVGDPVAVDEPLVELETDKVTLEVPAPVAGTLAEIIAQTGSDVAVGGLLGAIADGAAQTAATSPRQARRPERRPRRPKRPAARCGRGCCSLRACRFAGGTSVSTVIALSPAVRKLIEEHRLDPAEIKASGPGGRLTKGDVLEYVAGQGSGPGPGGFVPQPCPTKLCRRRRHRACSASDTRAPLPAPAPAPAEPAHQGRANGYG